MYNPYYKARAKTLQRKNPQIQGVPEPLCFKTMKPPVDGTLCFPVFDLPFLHNCALLHKPN